MASVKKGQIKYPIRDNESQSWQREKISSEENMQWTSLRETNVLYGFISPITVKNSTWVPSHIMKLTIGSKSAGLKLICSRWICYPIYLESLSYS